MLRSLLLATLLMLHLGAAAASPALPPLPPIVSPATDLSLPGKVVWADLFTSDVDRARRFYEGVFGWQWRVVKPGPDAYGVFYNDGEPVAGLAFRPARPGGEDAARWGYYFSVDDVEMAGRTIVEAGGRELLPATSFADRGTFAFYAGPAEEPFALLRSQSGDPPDQQARVGDFIWWQLFSRDVMESIDFYTRVFGYTAYRDENTPEVAQAFLGRDGYSRAAISLLRPEALAPPIWLGAIRIDDMDTALAATRAQGGTVLLKPRADLLNNDLAIILDPVGGAVALLRWDYEDADGVMPDVQEVGR